MGHRRSLERTRRDCRGAGEGRRDPRIGGRPAAGAELTTRPSKAGRGFVITSRSPRHGTEPASRTHTCCIPRTPVIPTGVVLNAENHPDHRRVGHVLVLAPNGISPASGPKGIRTPDLLAASQNAVSGVLTCEHAGRR